MGQFISKALVLVAAVILCSGCQNKLFKASKNTDIKRLAISAYDGVEAKEIYTERGVYYDRIAGGGPGGRGGATVAVHVPVYSSSSAGAAAAAGIFAVVIVAAALTEQGVRAETERRRSERLAEVGIQAKPILERRLDAEFTGGLRDFGYDIAIIPPLVHEDVQKKIGEDGGYHPNKMVPSWKHKDILEQSGLERGDAVLLVDLRNYGIYKWERAFRKARYVPYVVISVRMHRTDTGKLIHQADYLGLPAAPLPEDSGDFDAAVADSDLVIEFYDKAMTNALQLMLEDLRPDWSEEPALLTADRGE